MFENLPNSSIAQTYPTLVIAAVACAVIAAALLLWFLLKRPEINWGTRLVLLGGLGIFPIGTAMLGNGANVAHTQNRSFCGQCHIMTPYAEDSTNPESTTLAARHGRNEYFGHQNCYNCHQDYGMYGLVYTKIGGLKHVWHYYTEYDDYTWEEARPKLELYEPFTNRNCTVCHSMENQGWQDRSEHKQLMSELQGSEVSCVSGGCHGPAHPFSKDEGEVQRVKGEEHDVFEEPKKEESE